MTGRGRLMVDPLPFKNAYFKSEGMLKSSRELYSGGRYENLLSMSTRKR